MILGVVAEGMREECGNRGSEFWKIHVCTTQSPIRQKKNGRPMKKECNPAALPSF